VRKTFALVGCSVLLLSSVALAQPKGKPAAAKPAAPAAPAAPAVVAPPSLADSLKPEPKADYDSGKVLFGDGDFDGAFVKFQSAYDKAQDPRLLWNMAACQKNKRRYAKVLVLVRQYLTDGGALLSEADRKEADDLIKAVEPLTVAVRFKVAEPDAQIFIDDELVGKTPLEKPVLVDIGVRKIRVQKADYTEYSEQKPVGGAPEILIEANLVRIVHEGKLTVRARAGDDISIDGKPVAKGMWTGVLPSGGHALRVSATGYIPYQSEVIVQDKDDRVIPINLAAEPKRGIPTWAWVAGVVGVVGGATVVTFLVLDPKREEPTGTFDPGSVSASRPIRF